MFLPSMRMHLPVVVKRKVARLRRAAPRRVQPSVDLWTSEDGHPNSGKLSAERGVSLCQPGGSISLAKWVGRRTAADY
ncbi:uncharacterized protein MYCFIDRAFT_171427 [Pseudocercospora fijiensis CIRAD86]|uniref:Uncharacterized protein n=1 Tax=Pseudocercospora fijiensis (strain CIRAD86) TaxID=383855 RepID=M2Z6U0_PSEFD|nr:uncharacterized protein MYCFIDRAFT_171427 [Pseudocercospora fijiensis CIRAD86]EME85500.1 hypothetical protein MYCFIDRAFT_171427 [Pseudocercospora fijiensis CIRAD86]